MNKVVEFFGQMLYTAGFCSLPLVYGYWRDGTNPGWYGVCSVLIAGFIAGNLVTTEPAPTRPAAGGGE